MGMVSDFFGDGEVGDFVFGGKADLLDLGGMQEEDAAREAAAKAKTEQLDALDKSIAETRRSSAEGQAFLAPFAGVGQQGVELSPFLTDPQAQFNLSLIHI